MTAAAGIEIGISGTPVQGLVKALGTGVLGAGQPATAARSLQSSSASASGTESFGAGWQSLLASLDCGAAGSGELESQASQGKASAEKGAAGSSTTALSLASGTSLGLQPVADKEDGVIIAAANLSAAGALTGLGAARDTSGATQAVSLQTISTPTKGEKSTANSKSEASAKTEKTESAHGRHTADASDGTKTEGLAVVSMPEAVPAVVASLPLAAPVPTIVSSAPKTADEQAQSAQTDLLAGLSTGSPAAPFGHLSSSSEASSSGSEASSASKSVPGLSGQAKESESLKSESLSSPESLPSQEAALPVSSLSESSIQSLGKADSSAVVEDPSSATVTRAANESPLKTHPQSQSATQGQNATRTVTALKPNSTQTAASVQEPTETQVSEPSMTHGVSLSQSSSHQNNSQNSAQNPMALPAPTPDPAVVSTAASASTKSPEISSLESLPESASLAAAQSGQSAAASTATGKSDSASNSSKSTTSNTLRSVRGAGSLDSTQHGVHLVDGQSSGTAVDAGAVAREVAGAHGTASTAGSATGASSATATGTTAGETFAALDADTSTGKPTWVHAGAQRAEAGFQDSSLGWVSVRADASGGGVHAELVAGSSDAAQALGSHMAGLNAYLAEHHTPVDTLTLSSSGDGSAGGGWAGDGSAGGGSAASGSGQGAGDQMQQGTGQQSGQQQGQQSGQGTVQGVAAGFLSTSSAGSTALAAAASQSSAWSGRSDGDAYAATSSGSVHISVVA
jgi:hypothetical protein